tara:strand:+ start:1497 stop:1883 length:387 start_codon:yes stop_codon:yes gene_type:complete
MRWLALILLLSGCGLSLSSLNPFSGGSGPTVNSNAQIGAENRQAVVSVEQTEEVTAGRDVVQTEIVKEVEAGSVETLEIFNTNIPPWVIILLILGWLLPTPTEMVRGFTNFVLTLFGRKDNPKYDRYK